MSALVVGQELYRPPHNHRSSGTTLTIAKIGKKYATFVEGSRCTLDGLMLDCGGYSPNQLYLSKEIYEEKLAIHRAWFDLSRHMSSACRNPRVTLDAIAKARALLMLGGEV